MARVYKVSADTSEKEKIIGGVLTLAQGAWCAAGLLIIGGLFFLLITVLPPTAALILAAPPGVAVGVLFAFYRKEGLPLLTYLLYQRSFHRKSKRLPNDLTYRKDFVGQMQMQGGETP